MVVDNNENYYSAALRELKEETRNVNVKLIKEIEGNFTYDFTKIILIGIIWKGKYRGSKAKMVCYEICWK